MGNNNAVQGRCIVIIMFSITNHIIHESEARNVHYCWITIRFLKYIHVRHCTQNQERSQFSWIFSAGTLHSSQPSSTSNLSQTQSMCRHSTEQRKLTNRIMSNYTLFWRRKRIHKKDRNALALYITKLIKGEDLDQWPFIWKMSNKQLTDTSSKTTAVSNSK